jgi:hypothetical protein
MPPGKVRPLKKPVERWSPRDLSYLARALIPEQTDVDRLVDLLRDDEKLVDAMLNDDRLFEQLVAADDLLVSASPELFFKVLLLRARRDLEGASYTVERRQQQKIVLFDTPQVVELLKEPGVIDYLARMLASFMHINSVTIPVRVRPGLWRRIRVNDLDVDSLIRYADILDEEQRFPAYQRIADACLFLAGLFPEYVGRRARSRLGSLLGGLEQYEEYGQRFYALAARHPAAAFQALDQVLALLAGRFILAEKPLTFLSEQYLFHRKQRLFDV